VHRYLYPNFVALLLNKSFLFFNFFFVLIIIYIFFNKMLVIFWFFCVNVLYCFILHQIIFTIIHEYFVLGDFNALWCRRSKNLLSTRSLIKNLYLSPKYVKLIFFTIIRGKYFPKINEDNWLVLSWAVNLFRNQALPTCVSSQKDFSLTRKTICQRR
jgi:hypothetical protein